MACSSSSPPVAPNAIYGKHGRGGKLRRLDVAHGLPRRRGCRDWSLYGSEPARRLRRHHMAAGLHTSAAKHLTAAARPACCIDRRTSWPDLRHGTGSKEYRCCCSGSQGAPMTSSGQPTRGCRQLRAPIEQPNAQAQKPSNRNSEAWMSAGDARRWPKRGSEISGWLGGFGLVLF